MRFGVTTEDNAIPVLRALIRAAEDMTPLYHGIGAYVEDSTKARFRDGEDPSGTAWLPSIRVKEHGGKTLFDSGITQGSISYQMEPDGIYVGTPFFWAVAHQTGMTIKPKNGRALVFKIGGATVFAKSVTIPKREIFGISAEDEEAMEELLDKHFGQTADQRSAKGSGSSVL